MMKKIVIFLTSVMIILGGCTVSKDNDSASNSQELSGYHFPNEQEMKEMDNGLLTNPKVIQDDKLLFVGDYGLEKQFGSNVQNSPNEYDSRMIQKVGNDHQYNIRNISTSTIRPTYVNPKIKPIGGSYVNNVIGKGWDYYGTSYQLGSDRNNPKTFDCSDFTRWIHLITLGMDLPKTSSTQWAYVKKFSKRKYTDLSQAKRGDLLFFMGYRGWQKSDYNGINVKAQPVSHVGVYLGDGLMLHTASQKTGGVRYDRIKGSHLEYRFIGGGKVIQ